MKRKLLTALLCSSLLMPGTVVPVIAQEAGTELQSEATIVHSGKIGTADWTIDSDGVLTIGEGEFTNDNLNYKWPWEQYGYKITHVNGKADFKIYGNIRGFFNGVKAKTMDLSGWDTSSVTDMSNTFYQCSSLIDLNISSWDTSSVIDMVDMFYCCTSLTKLDIGACDTSSVTNMNGLFSNRSSLTDLKIGSWNTSSVTNMNGMFGVCSSIHSLDIELWDTSSVENMGQMFVSCRSLANLNLSSWDVSSVKSMSYMFENCSSLKNLDIRSWDVSKVVNMCEMFSKCNALTSLNVRSWNTSSVKNMMLVFEGCSSMNYLDIGSWTTRNVEIKKGNMLKGCSGLEVIHYSQSTVDFLSSLPEQTGWYQNQQGPYDISNLPELGEGQIALLARDPSVTPNPGGDDLDPDNNYELTSSVNNNDPAIVRRGHSLMIKLRLNKDGTLDNTFNMSHRKDSDILVSVNNSESLEISSCSFADDGSLYFS